MSEVQSITNMTKDRVAGKYDAGEVAESNTLVCKDGKMAGVEFWNLKFHSQ